MGLFDGVKQTIKDAQAKASETKEARGLQLAQLVAIDYVGGWGDQSKTLGNLVFFEKRVEFQAPLNSKRSFSFPTGDVVGLAIEGKDDVAKRVTVTRLLAVGVFAFALKKNEADKDGFVTLTLRDGHEVVFHKSDASPRDLKMALAKVSSRVGVTRAQMAPAPATASDPYEDLRKLAELKELGVVTEAEFEAKKASLLERM